MKKKQIRLDVSYLDGYGTNEEISSDIKFVPFISIRGDRIYTIFEGPSWTESEKNSNKVGGHLVAIDNAEENKWLLDTYDIDGLYPVNHNERGEPAPGEDAYWIGLTDKDKGVNGNGQIIKILPIEIGLMIQRPVVMVLRMDQQGEFCLHRGIC